MTALPAFPLVTVIMPVRNEAAFIERSLLSVLGQDYPADLVHVLVIDGDSTDATPQIVERIALSHPERDIRLLNNPARIVPTGFNLGLEQARGEVVVRVDGHCEVNADYVRQCVEAFHRSGAACVGGLLQTIGSGRAARAIAVAQSSRFGVGGATFRTGCDEGMFVDTLAFGAYRREYFDRIGGYDEELVRNQDDEFHFRLTQSGGTIWLDPLIRSTYYSRANFGKLWRQYYQYGYYKVRVIQKRRGVASPRQLVPSLFVLALVLSVLATIASGWWPLLLPVGGAYLAACVGAGLWTARTDLQLAPGIIVAFAILHFAYGSGFLHGLWQWRNRWGEPSQVPFPTRAAGDGIPVEPATETADDLSSSHQPATAAMRENFLHFALPDLDGSELQEIQQCLASGWVTTGPRTRQFEQAFAAAVGARHAIAVNSCTAAMHLALEAAGVRRGDEVITTPYTFAATAEVVRYFDAKPVFVDVDPLTFNMRAEAIEAAITERTKAILPIHIAGMPADMDAILEVARRHNLVVVEDAAHAFPAAYKGRSIGSISDMTCFSFYATKTITTGEGGMITTNSDQFAERCRIMALHGISKDAWKRYTAEGSWYYEIMAPGYKYNLSDVASSMGLAQLRRAEQMRARRVSIAQRYNEAFKGHPAFQVPEELPDCTHAWHLYMLRLNLDRLTVDRAAFVEELKNLNIGTSVHFIPLHIHPYYREQYGYKPEDFPVAYREYQREISIPIYSGMSDADVGDVIDAVRRTADRLRKAPAKRRRPMVPEEVRSAAGI